MPRRRDPGVQTELGHLSALTLELMRVQERIRQFTLVLRTSTGTPARSAARAALRRASLDLSRALAVYRRTISQGVAEKDPRIC